jgi:hypothetical protein
MGVCTYRSDTLDPATRCTTYEHKHHLCIDHRYVFLVMENGITLSVQPDLTKAIRSASHWFHRKLVDQLMLADDDAPDIAIVRLNVGDDVSKGIRMPYSPDDTFYGRSLPRSEPKQPKERRKMDKSTDRQLANFNSFMLHIGDGGDEESASDGSTSSSSGSDSDSAM